MPVTSWCDPGLRQSSVSKWVKSRKISYKDWYLHNTHVLILNNFSTLSVFQPHISWTISFIKKRGNYTRMGDQHQLFIDALLYQVLNPRSYWYANWGIVYFVSSYKISHPIDSRSLNYRVFMNNIVSCKCNVKSWTSIMSNLQCSLIKEKFTHFTLAMTYVVDVNKNLVCSGIICN